MGRAEWEAKGGKGGGGGGRGGERGMGSGGARLRDCVASACFVYLFSDFTDLTT